MSGIDIVEALRGLARELSRAQAAQENGDSASFEIIGAEVDLGVEAERRPDGSTGYTVVSRSGTKNVQAYPHRLRLVVNLRESDAQLRTPNAEGTNTIPTIVPSADDYSPPSTKRALDRSGAIEPLTIEILKRRITDTFSAGYLTVIAIIQGVALGILLTTAQTHFSQRTDLAGHLTVISQALATFTAIVIVTHQYLILTALVRWTPTALDTAIPYALGVGEIGASLVIGDNTLWWANFSVLLLVGAGAFSYSIVRGSTRVFGTMSDFHKQYRESLGLQITASVTLALGCITLSSLSYFGVRSDWFYALAPFGVALGGIAIEFLGDRDQDDVFVDNGIPWWRFRSSREESPPDLAHQSTPSGSTSVSSEAD